MEFDNMEKKLNDYLATIVVILGFMLEVILMVGTFIILILLHLIWYLTITLSVVLSIFFILRIYKIKSLHKELIEYKK